MSYEPTVWVDGDHVTSTKLNKLEQGVNSMSYVPTVWNAGDVVTAEKLNKLEQGVAESGGGGDSDFTTANITLSVEEGSEALYSINFYESWSDPRRTGAYYSDEDGLSTESAEVNVGSESVVEKVYIVKDHYIVVTGANGDETFTITGNAEAFVLVYPDTGDTYNAVKVYGDCTITLTDGST